MRYFPSFCWCAKCEIKKYIKIRARNLRNFSTNCEQQVNRLSNAPNKDPLHLGLRGLPTVVNTDGVKAHSIGLLCILLRIAWIPYPTLSPSVTRSVTRGLRRAVYTYLFIYRSQQTYKLTAATTELQGPKTESPKRFLYLTFRHRTSCTWDRLFSTLQRTLFIYLINNYISLSDICLTVHH